MDETRLPRIHGFTRVSAHICPRCGTAARILYVATGGPQEKENTATGYRETRFATGTLLISNDHFDNGHGAQYGYYGSCGYLVPTLASATEAFINQLYARLHPKFYGYSYNNEAPDKRIVSFDVQAILKAPWLLWAKAIEPGEPPIALLPHPSLLRLALMTGSIPKVGTTVAQLDQKQIEAAPAAFLAAIGATTEARSF